MLGTRSLAQALQVYAGLELHDTTGNGSQVAISMRGFGANASNNTLFLVNDIPLTNPDLAAVDLNNIPLFAIQQIEVITNSESVLYGDQAVGGIINIITEDRNLSDAISMRCEAGSYNFERCYVHLKKQQRIFNFFFSLSNIVTDNYREHNNYKQTLLLSGGKYIMHQGFINFHYQFAKETMQYPGALTRNEVFENRRQANNDINFFKDDNQSILIKHEKNLNDNLLLSAVFSGKNMEGNGVLYSPFSQRRSSFFLKPQIKTIWKNLVITHGFDFQQDTYRLNSLFGLTNDNQQKYGAFILGNVSLNPQWKIIGGIRLAEQVSQLTDPSSSSIKNINRAFVDSIGFVFNYTSSLNFYLRQAGSFRFPKAEENASTINGQGLKTQRGNAYETGLQWDDHKINLKLNLYQLNLKDEIAFDPTQTTQQPFGINTNLPPTTRHGLSLSLQRTICPSLSMSAQYNHVNARFRNGPDMNKFIPLVAENIINANLTYKINQYLNSSAEFVYTGSQYAANDNANVAGKIGGYSVFNVNLNLKHKELAIMLRINNLFSKKYYLYTVYQFNQQFFYPAAERNFLLTIQYYFL